ncbi:uncharacterized protein LOC110841492 isoform X2 [Zootermopsis nevadensis]|nr:uncharacterized protein LOC110841492 isoform X2 [Zootermopsis nevadensis]
MGLKRSGSFFTMQSSFLADGSSSGGEDEAHMELSLHLWRQRNYLQAEEEEIVNYVVRHNAYGLVKGTALWKLMEENMVCKKRTWQSMKERFLKKILPNIKSFNLSESQIALFNNIRDITRKQRQRENLLQESTSQLNRRCGSSSENNGNQSNSSVEHCGDQNKQNFFRSSNFYREDEDKALLNFIVQKKRYDRAGGVHLWMFMEQKQVVPGRSWQSMKERYRKTLMKKLNNYLPSDVVTKIMKAEVKRAKKKKTSSANGIHLTQNPEVGSTQKSEPETNIRSNAHPDHPALGCTCCFDSSTDASVGSIDSTVFLPSIEPNKREYPQNHISKRKLFSQRESLMEFSPVLEDEKRIQSSRYLHMPRQQFHHKELNSRSDDRGQKSGVTVVKVACTLKKSQQSKDIPAYDTIKSYLPQEMIGDDEVPKELAERSHIENTPEEETVFCKESEVLKVTSIAGGNKGQVLDDGIQENMSNKRNEVQRKSNRKILNDCSVLEEPSCGKPQDEVQEVYFTSNCERCESEYVATQQNTDVQLQNVTVSVNEHEGVTGDKDLVVEANKEKHVARLKNVCDVGNAAGFSIKCFLNEEAANINHDKSVQRHHNTKKLMNKKCLNEVMPHKKSGNCVLAIKKYGKEIFIEEIMPFPEASAQKLSANEHIRERSDGIPEKFLNELNLEDLSDNESSLKDYCFTHKIVISPKTQSDDTFTNIRSLSQSSYSKTPETYSCSRVSFNDEDVLSGGNSHNILKQKHFADNRHDNGKSFEKADNGTDEIDEGFTENNMSTSIIHIQPCTEKNDHGGLWVFENISGKVNIDSNSEGGNDIPMLNACTVDGKSSNSMREIMNDCVHLLEDNSRVLGLPVEKLIPSTTLNGHTEFADKEQTHEVSETTHSLPLSSCVESSCELTPENIIADVGQHSEEQSSFSCPSQESVPSLSAPSSEDSTHNKNNGLTGRLLERSEKGSLACWFKSSTENSNSSARWSGCDVCESSCNSSAYSAACKSLKKNQWWKSKDCSICDRCETMEPCMEDA